MDPTPLKRMKCEVSFTGAICPRFRLPPNCTNDVSKTSDFILTFGEYLAACPYDVSHLIRNVRMDGHVSKCRKRYIMEKTRRMEPFEYVNCPNKICSTFPAVELKYHMERCVVVGELVYPKKRSKPVKKHIPEEPTESNNVDEEEEDWEQEANGYQPGYDPTQKLLEAGQLIRPVAATKWERKEYHRALVDKSKVRFMEFEKGIHRQEGESPAKQYRSPDTMADLRVGKLLPTEMRDDPPDDLPPEEQDGFGPPSEFPLPEETTNSTWDKYYTWEQMEQDPAFDIYSLEDLMIYDDGTRNSKLGSDEELFSCGNPNDI